MPETYRTDGRDRLLLFPRPDIKFQLWARGIESVSDRHKALPTWRPWFAFVHFIRYRRRGYRIDAFVVRYLNDPGSLAGASIRLIGDSLSLFAARLLRIPVFWVIHNLDRETRDRRPWIIRIRRHLVKRSACAFFVTEESLVDHARRIHRIEGPIRVTPLGRPGPALLRPEQDSEAWLRFQSRADAWLESGPGDGPCFLVVGTPENKYSHFWRLGELLDYARKNGIPLRAVVIAPLNEAYGRELREALSDHERRGAVLFSEKFVETDWHWAAEHCIALLRGYTDLSMSHAIYHSVAVGMPILALPGGVVPRVVQEEGIGEALEADFGNLEAALERLTRLDEQITEGFLSRRSERRAAEAMIEAVLQANQLRG